MPLPGLARAQAALAAMQVDARRLPPEARLTLRPTLGLEILAEKVAKVLSVRTGAVVVVGDSPPAGMLEAVPAGHVALAFEGERVRLVLGAALGRSLEAYLALAGDTGEPDVRSVALAIEALRDQAIETSAAAEDAPGSSSGEVSAAAAPAGPAFAEELAPAERASRPNDSRMDLRDEGELSPLRPYGEGRYLKPVEPLFYLRAYGGASTASNAPRMGVGTGGGLCVRGHCLLLTADYPIPLGTQVDSRDVRYSYLTFTSGFYTHPFSVGRFTPGASVSFLSRVGHFERDMGLADRGLETDLGVRGTLELGYEVVTAVDMVAELGLDYALDRWRLSRGGSVAYRGPRAMPWLQVAVRVRPY